MGINIQLCLFILLDLKEEQFWHVALQGLRKARGCTSIEWEHLSEKYKVDSREQTHCGSAMCVSVT